MNDVILFRAVMEGEHAQIHDTNNLQNPGGIESKYFATSERGANLPNWHLAGLAMKAHTILLE